MHATLRSGFYLNRNACRRPSNHTVSLTTAIAVYFIIWWIVLFAVLPWGVRSQQESGAVEPGTDPGAPTIPKVWRKLAWTTVAASVVFALCAVAYSYRLINLDELTVLLRMPR